MEKTTDLTNSHLPAFLSELETACAGHSIIFNSRLIGRITRDFPVALSEKVSCACSELFLFCNREDYPSEDIFLERVVYTLSIYGRAVQYEWLTIMILGLDTEKKLLQDLLKNFEKAITLDDIKKEINRVGDILRSLNSPFEIDLPGDEEKTMEQTIVGVSDKIRGRLAEIVVQKEKKLQSLHDHIEKSGPFVRFSKIEDKPSRGDLGAYFVREEPLVVTDRLYDQVERAVVIWKKLKATNKLEETTIRNIQALQKAFYQMAESSTMRDVTFGAALLSLFA